MRTGVVKKAFPFAFDGITLEHLAVGRVVSMPDGIFDGLADADYIEPEADVSPADAALNARMVEAVDRKLAGASDEEMKDIVARSGTPYSGKLVHAELALAAKEQLIREMEQSASGQPADPAPPKQQKPDDKQGSLLPATEKPARETAEKKPSADADEVGKADAEGERGGKKKG